MNLRLILVCLIFSLCGSAQTEYFNVTQSEELEREMFKWRSEYDRIHKLQMISILKDEAIIDKDAAIEALEANYPFEKDPVGEIIKRLNRNEFVQAADLINELETNSEELSDLNTLFTIKEGLHDESLNWTDIQADVDELSTSENTWIAEEAAFLYSLHTGIKILEPVNAPQVHVSSRMHTSGSSTHKFQYFTVYPNPASEFCVLELANNVSLTKDAEIILLDVQGKEVLQFVCSSDNQQILELGGLVNGVYTLILLDSDEVIAKEKLIIGK